MGSGRGDMASLRAPGGASPWPLVDAWAYRGGRQDGQVEAPLGPPVQATWAVRRDATGPGRGWPTAGPVRVREWLPPRLRVSRCRDRHRAGCAPRSPVCPSAQVRDAVVRVATPDARGARSERTGSAGATAARARPAGSGAAAEAGAGRRRRQLARRSTLG